MKRKPVTSSNVVGVGWADNILEVEFKSGIYQYLDVPVAIFDDCMGAPSIGQFINAHVKPVFKFRKAQLMQAVLNDAGNCDVETLTGTVDDIIARIAAFIRTQGDGSVTFFPAAPGG